MFATPSLLESYITEGLFDDKETKVMKKIIKEYESKNESDLYTKPKDKKDIVNMVKKIIDDNMKGLNNYESYIQYRDYEYLINVSVDYKEGDRFADKLEDLKFPGKKYKKVGKYYYVIIDDFLVEIEDGINYLDDYAATEFGTSCTVNIVYNKEYEKYNGISIDDIYEIYPLYSDKIWATKKFVEIWQIKKDKLDVSKYGKYKFLYKYPHTYYIFNKELLDKEISNLV